VKVLVAVLCLWLFLFPGAAQADTVRLAIGEWPPFTSSHEPSGKLAEQIVIEAFSLVDMNVEMDYLPWKRSFEYTLSGQYDGTFPWYSTDSRQAEFLISHEPVIEEREVFFHRRDVDFDWQHLDDLRPYRIGGTIGYSHVEVLTRAGVNVRTAASDELNIRMLQAGRIDAFPVSYYVGRHLIDSLFTPEEAAQLVSHPKPLTEGYLYLLVSKHIENGEDIVRQFDEGIRLLRSSGRYDQLLSQHITAVQ